MGECWIGDALGPLWLADMPHCARDRPASLA